MFNSDALARIAVAVNLANANGRGELPGSGADRPDHIFRTHGYQPPANRADWACVARVAEPISAMLRLITAGEHDQAVKRLNLDLRRQHVVPQIESHHDTWNLHFHSSSAAFAEGWEAGITAALAIGYATGEWSRIGICISPDCHDLFVDRGRNQQRRFCSLQCQNRAKSADYRHRRGSS